MWCPNCKNEYVPGITRCADCGARLVESLVDAGTQEDAPAASVPPEAERDRRLRTDADNEPELAAYTSGSPGDEGAADSPVAAAHAYVSCRTKAEDMKSTAYTFTLTGTAGLVLLALFAFGILPVHTASYLKVMICLVMGAMFLIFLLVGVNSFRQVKALETAADDEEALFAELMDWFPAAYTAKEIDARHGAGGQEETLYFARYEVMQRLIAEHCPSLEESFLDHVIEELYAKLF